MEAEQNGTQFWVGKRKIPSCNKNNSLPTNVVAKLSKMSVIYTAIHLLAARISGVRQWRGAKLLILVLLKSHLSLAAVKLNFESALLKLTDTRLFLLMRE